MVDKTEILSQILKLVSENAVDVVVIIVILLGLVAGLIFVAIKLILAHLKDIKKIPNIENLHSIFENQLSDFHEELHEVRNKIGHVEVLSQNHPEIHSAIEDLRYKIEHILDELESNDGKCLNVFGRLENHENRIKELEKDCGDLQDIRETIVRIKVHHKNNHDEDI